MALAKSVFSSLLRGGFSRFAGRSSFAPLENRSAPLGSWGFHTDPKCSCDSNWKIKLSSFFDPRLIKFISGLFISTLFCSQSNAQQLTWTAAPSQTNSTFLTQAEALNDLHAFGPEYALMTEVVSITQQGDRLTYEYKIPDADPFVGDWLYYSEASYHSGFPTEAEAFDELLQAVVDARSAGVGGCPPYAEIFPATIPAGTGNWLNYGGFQSTVLGVSRNESKAFSGEYYATNVVDNSGLCKPFSPVQPPGAGFLIMTRVRSVTCPQYQFVNEQVGKCVGNRSGILFSQSQYYLEAPISSSGCEGEGNPCHPATGNKSQRETDIGDLGDGGLGFVRYYNSLGDHNSSPSLARGWRHTFDRHLNESTLGAPAKTPSVPEQSNQYASAYLACTQGWSEIKDTVWDGSLSGATASFAGAQDCRIELGGKAVAMFNIRPTLSRYIPLAQPNSNSTSVIALARPDGQVYHFNYVDGTIWKDPSSPEVTLVTAGGDWLFTDADNTQELYDSSGKLLSITDVRGNIQTLTYDASDHLDRVDTNTGEFIQFGYDTADRISTVTDNTGRIWTYRYNANGNLEFVDNPDSTTRQYHYEDLNFSSALTGITDERLNRYATWAYNPEGKAILSEHAGGVERVNLTYNPDGTTTVQSISGASRTYSFAPERGNLAVMQIVGDQCTTCSNGNKKDRSYDSNGYLDSYTDWGNIVTTFGNYDSKGQYGFKIEAVGTPQQRRVDYTYDSRFFNKITTLTEPSVFAGNSKVTTHTYDAFGNRTATVVNGFNPAGNPVSRTTTRQYNGPLNQLSQRDGPRTDVSNITQYRYYPNDASQPVGTRARLQEIEAANGILTRSNIQYTATGKVSSETRPNGQSLTYTYYAGNDRLQTLTETSAAGSRVTRWAYLATGEVESLTSGDGTPDATTLTFGYDDARRLTRITDGLDNYIAYTLDTEGNRTAEKTYDNTDALKKQLSQTFDIYNRLDTTAQANESTNPTFAADGTLDLQTDGNGAVTDYSYDALKRLTQMIQDQGGTDTDTANASTGYGYDVADRLTNVTDPVNGNTSYAYDDLGNLVNQSSPDTGTTGFQYDGAGNVVQKTDALGQLFTYSYDALNRLTSLDAPGSDDDISYSYDSCLNGSGRLCRVTYGSGALPNGNRVHYQYNGFGDLIDQGGIAYSYDAQGRVQTIDYPSGAKLDYGYDAAGQISQVDFTVNGVTQTLAGSLSYAPFGPITGLSYGNGLSLVQSVDEAYRLTAQTIPGVLERSYPQYDANGNRLSQTDALASTSGFAYDALNRLDTANGPFGNRDYTYDQNGNRVELVADSVTTALAYEPNSNRLDTLGATDILLDANGNTLNNADWSYTYTPHNRLGTATETATLKASFGYNGLGQRITKRDEVAATGRHFLYGSSGELLVETDADGNVLVEYLYLNGQLLAVYSPDDDQDGQSNQQEAALGTLPVNIDSDGDGLLNVTEWLEQGTDSNNADSDGDGASDGYEVSQGSDPRSAASVPSANGDLNQDGQLNVGDLVLLYQFVLNTRTPTASDLVYGDMNQDGELSLPDVLLLQKLLLQSWLDGETVIVYQPPAPRYPASPVLLSWLNQAIPPASAVPVNSGELFYVHNDPLGTPQALTNESGVVVWTAETDPFGQAIVTNDPDGDGNSVTLNVRFPGQYYDQETGLHYNYFRYYDPSTGRYLTADPVGHAGGINLYTYVDNNPTGYMDPHGLTAVGSKFSGRQKLGSDVSDLFSPSDFHWLTPAPNSGCFIGPIYSYVWKCRNVKPPQIPFMCQPSDDLPDWTEVTTTKPVKPAGECYFSRRKYVGYGWNCRINEPNVTTPPRHYFERTK